MDVMIRQFKSEDLPAVLDVTRRAWGLGSSFECILDRSFGERGNQSGIEKKVAEIEAMCRKNADNIFVAELDGKVAGYASYHMNQVESVGRITNNAVDPACQGKGIGTKLQTKILKTLLDLGAEVLLVGTMESDIAAQRLYSKFGFKELCRSIHYGMKRQDVRFPSTS